MDFNGGGRTYPSMLWRIGKGEKIYEEESKRVGFTLLLPKRHVFALKNKKPFFKKKGFWGMFYPYTGRGYS
jgi:hypothetical protein